MPGYVDTGSAAEEEEEGLWLASAVAETEWKLTLCAISEDNTVVVMVEKTKKKEEIEVQTVVGMGSEMVES